LIFNVHIGKMPEVINSSKISKILKVIHSSKDGKITKLKHSSKMPKDQGSKYIINNEDYYKV